MPHLHVQRVRVLYKTILKLHRGLPPELKDLGTKYVHDEFKRHKKCTPSEATVFIREWTEYAITLTKQLGLRGPQTGTEYLGTSLREADLEKFKEEQLYQLYELMEAATKAQKDPNR